MKLGLFGVNIGVGAQDPAVLARVATAAERAGWESVWTGEHYVLPAEFAPPSPSPPDTPMLDPFVALATVAAHTSTLLVGTGVTVVPLHQPLALAKRVASLDVVSGGRLLFGVGAGYLEPEFAALGAPFDRRGARLMEHLVAMRAVWAGESVRGVRAEPPPRRPEGPPLHFGGYVPAAFRRAVAHGHGWYGFALDMPRIEECLGVLRDAESAVRRPDDLPDLEVTVTPHPRMALDGAVVARLAELGVDRLVLLPPRSAGSAADTDGERLLRFVDEEPARLEITPAG